MTRLEIPGAGERDALATLVGRAVAMDPATVVRLRGAGGRVAAFASTPFEVLVTGDAAGSVTPDDVTVAGTDLLAALAVAGGPSVDPGGRADQRWRGPVPVAAAWSVVGTVAAADADAAAQGGIEALRAAGHPSATLLDGTALSVAGLRVPMRCLLALSGAGLLGPADLSVTTDGTWLRVDAADGAVVRRRVAQLPLVM